MEPGTLSWRAYSSPQGAKEEGKTISALERKRFVLHTVWNDHWVSVNAIHKHLRVARPPRRSPEEQGVKCEVLPTHSGTLMSLDLISSAI